MKSDKFWSVELGVRMGPLILGAEYEALLQVLRDHRIDVDRLSLDATGKVLVHDLQTQFVFSTTYPRTLLQMDVEDERLRFGPLSVIGKRVHEIIGIFKVSRKDTLWSSNESLSELSDSVNQNISTAQSRELLAGGSIWIPSLGLGLSLRDGLVATVHLCDPAHAPRNGRGTWTKEQQRLSEVRELPAISTSVLTQRRRSFVLSALIHLTLIASIGILIGWAFLLQQKWNEAQEVSAVVIALTPPPPNPLPVKVTVSFNDSAGRERQQTLGYRQFEMVPKLGDEVKVRYLLDAPNQVLGPVASRDVGFDSAFPIGMGILAIYSFVRLISAGVLPLRRRQKNYS